MSKIGFYSIVKDKDETFGITTWEIRARQKQDLVNLRREAGFKQVETSIIETRASDYQFRMIVNEDELQELMITLGELVDYPNFKEEVSKQPDQQKKVLPYSKIWLLLAEALDARKSGRGAK